MKNKAVRIVVKVIIIAAILVPLAFLLKDSSDQLRGGYDASAPTPAKFAKLMRWLPDDADLIAIMDVHRLFAEPGIRAKVMGTLEHSGGFWGFDAAAIRPLISDRGTIGLVAVAMKLGERGKPASFLAMVQGRVDEQAMVARIKEQLSDERENVVVDDTAGIPVYAGVDDEFAFSFPDSHHMVFGSRDEVRAVAMRAGSPDVKGDGSSSWTSVNADAPLFGRLIITPRTKPLLPAQLEGITRATFYADTDLIATIDVVCASPAQVENLELFIDGARATLVVMEQSDSVLATVLDHLSLTTEANVLKLRLRLHDLW